ncbi:methyl-accepting chemotaxis protein [Pseudomonas taiwanensis]|uniref:methyl-accepting chemotaxis protein n=1 Tax=Pseudomonas taiwanensis TaxID=470150 RepID=UPI0016494DBB|nr:methyl-accepting chemotaxis protein [Pseudomonas taiwanensis]MBC3491561.1 methyl-accepting chemotaxis protein [Pseudomonas taiwanensis]
MPSFDTPTFDFQRAAARQFGDRPTLRQVASEQLLKLLLAELPWLASVQPALSSADPLTLDSPDPSTPYWNTQPLVERVLQAMLQTQSIDLQPLDGRHHNLGLIAPYRFAGSSSAYDTRQLPDLGPALDELIERLPQHFCQAQLDYWNGVGSGASSRDSWMQLLLKTALLRGLPLQGLDAQEQACIRGLIRGGGDQPDVSFVQVELSTGSRSVNETLGHLLVTGEWDEREVILWCAPSGQVSSFASMKAFAVALRNELAQRYSFDAMSWQRYRVEGNVAAQQVVQLLEQMFERVQRVRYGRLADVPALEQLFAQLSDPAQWFISYLDDTPAVKPPPGLLTSADNDTFQYRNALLQLAVDHLDAEGVAALDGVMSLHDYTHQRLSEQMLKEHGDAMSPDELLLEFYIASGIPGGSATGAGGGEPLAWAGEKTLTEYAIGKLGSLKDASVIRIRHAQGATVPAWLNAEAARRLVERVDIGGTYPRYVAQVLDDPLQRDRRVQRFGREWRNALRFSALQGKLDGKITDTGLQCVVNFCNGHDDPDAPRITLMPLTFRRQPQSRHDDTVRGMYVLFCAEPTRVLLYRPLYRQDTLREYASFEKLLEHVQTSVRLQASVLDWLQPQVRHIYDNGGFIEPHVASIGLDPSSLPERPAPPVLQPVFWNTSLDNKLYDANRDLLVELADQQSTSNAERRWETLSQGAWLLFDVVTLVLRGPVASVTWMVQLLTSLDHDLLALEQEGDFDRSAAVVDLLLNLGMVLLHARQPGALPEGFGQIPDALALEGLAAQSGAFREISLVPSEGPVAMVGALGALPDRQLDFTWRGNHGFNWLPPTQRQALRAMRSGVAFDSSSLQASGGAAGLHLVDGQFYAVMSADAYPVEVTAQGVRVIDGKGGYGPWLVHVDGGWRVDSTLRLAGGMKNSRLGKNLAAQFEALRHSVEALDSQGKVAISAFSQISLDITELLEKIDKLKALRQGAQATLEAGGSADQRKSTEAVIEHYDARIAQWQAQLLSKRHESVPHLEVAVQKDKQIKVKLDAMLEPKYSNSRSQALDSAIQQHRDNVLSSLIYYSDFILNELWSLADYTELLALKAAVEGQPLVQVQEQYLAYLDKLKRVAAVQDRILSAYEDLDVLLVEAPADLVISIGMEAVTRTAGSLIPKRKFSTVQFRFHHVLNLADLALNLGSVNDQHILRGYRKELAGHELRNVAGAHGELDFANLPVDDRITILQDAWDGYSEALLNSARIGREGGALVRGVMLDRYRTELEKLKADAGRRLVDAVEEAEKGVVASQRKAYLATTNSQRVVRNGKGQILIGTVISENGQDVLEVREPFSDTLLARFDRVNDRWQERDSEPVSAEPVVQETDSAMRVQRLLDENAQLSRKADEYVKSDIKGTRLAQLFDEQVDKLGREVDWLTRQGASTSLIKALEAASDELRAEKNLKLIKLYTETRYPTAEALRFLHSQQLLRVQYMGPRQVMRNDSAFDEYKIMRTQAGAASGRPLWVAHFHMRSADSPARDFTRGHLKTWAQRRVSSQEAAQMGRRVHRGRLTLEQAEGIIPFD